MSSLWRNLYLKQHRKNGEIKITQVPYKCGMGVKQTQQTHFGFDSSPPFMYMNSEFGYTTVNLKSKVHLWKAKAEDHAYWKNSIYAAWFAFGIRIARNHATGWYHSMRSLTTCFWSLQNNQERTLFAIKFNALKKLVTTLWHLDCMDQPTWNNWSLCLKSYSK